MRLGCQAPNPRFFRWGGEYYLLRFNYRDVQSVVVQMGPRLQEVGRVRARLAYGIIHGLVLPPKSIADRAVGASQGISHVL